MSSEEMYVLLSVFPLNYKSWHNHLTLFNLFIGSWVSFVWIEILQAIIRAIIDYYGEGLNSITTITILMSE